MKVKELIKKLQSLDQGQDILIHNKTLGISHVGDISKQEVTDDNGIRVSALFIQNHYDLITKGI